jgi:hypothetical protein
MRWISAKQLEDWARTIGSRLELAKIVSDLIRASAPDIASIRFPSGDKGQVRGFDGHLESNVGALNVPEGTSYWEFGTESDYQAKAKRDFEKRTGEVSIGEQRRAVLVIVSPWTWDSSNSKNKIEAFVKACKRSSDWKDVQYIDGVALEAWLEQRPAVSAWHARNTLKTYSVDGIRSTDEFWENFAGQFGPPITEDVLLCERDKAAEQLIRDLQIGSNSVSLVADSPDEVVAFAIAAIRKAPAETRLFLEARTLIVDSVGAGRQLPSDGKLVLFLRGDAAKSPRQFFAMGATLVPLGRQQQGLGSPVLDRPTSYAMSVAMRSMKLEENRALALASGSGRSLRALARLIPGGSFDEPSWLGKGSELLPAILAGAWDASNDLDREVIEIIAGGTPYQEIERRIRAWLPSADPPFDLEGSVWKVRAPMDAFIRVGQLIGRYEVEFLRTGMLKVFAKIAPEINRDEIVNWSQPKPPTYSEWLREGLATTLDLLAVWGDVARVNLGGDSGQNFANRVVNDLPGLRTDARLLTSLGSELRLIAEAAPDPLLSALEHMLEGAGELIRPIFKERPNLLYPTSEHTGVLWALETIAWDPTYFRRAVMVLARLAAIDPGGRLANRPSRSLTEIFILWNPNTNASSAERLAALDQIIKALPGVGWELLVTLLPTMHGTSTPTAKPKLREAGAADRPPVTYGELWSNQAAIAERAVALAGHSLTRWLELAPRIASFAPKEREIAIKGLENAFGKLNDDERKVLWTKLRDEINKHERFKSAPWALPDSELEPLRALAVKFTPVDPIVTIISLFDAWTLDDAGDLSKGAHRRAAAVRQLYAEGGPEAVLRLATEVRVSYLVIEAAYGADFSPEQVERLFSISFDRAPTLAITTGLSGLYRNKVGVDRAEAWIKDALKKRGATPETIGSVLQGWPNGSETWNVVRRLGQGVVEAYWKQCAPHFVKGSRSELMRSLIMRLRYGRASEAIQSSLNRLKEIPSRLMLRMLDGLIPQLNAKSAVPDTMTSYYLEQVLQALDKRDDITAEDIARREYQFFPLLEYGSRHLRIYELMGKDPRLYHSFLRKVFRAKGEDEGGGETDPNKVADARISYSLLHHFSLLPGQGPDGIDRGALTSWIDELRRLGEETGISDATDSFVGRVLAHAQSGADGIWPPEPVREQIERLASHEVERAVQMQRFNMRGPHFRAVYEGGTEERAFAKVSYEAANALAAWPRTAELLRSIGQMWENEGKREDIEAAQRRLKS